MNKGLYSKLAFDGIKKNGKLYVPYIISIVFMVAILYILTYLSEAPALTDMMAGDNMRAIMKMGVFVMMNFSVIFLIYTNSFLTKRRNSEFALYNVLGMNKINVIRIIAREYVFIGLFSIVSGLGLGVILSKLFELILMKMCGYEQSFIMYFSKLGLFASGFFFVVILAGLFVLASIRILRNKPIDLLKSKNYGEKALKSNWFVGILGAVILIAAYVIALNCKTVGQVISEFFMAVIMVIIATYMIFISGSVFLCSVLKKKKNYYYTKKHFVSLSGMAYRMKRNGAGLASICILSTMVLVMIASAGSLYFGKNKSLKALYPYEFTFYSFIEEEELGIMSPEAKEAFSEVVDGVTADVDVVGRKECEIFSMMGGLSGNVMNIYDTYIEATDTNTLPLYVSMISLSEYNRMGDPVTLSDNEMLIGLSSGKYLERTMEYLGKEYNIAGETDDRFFDSNNMVVEGILLVLPDMERVIEEVKVSGCLSMLHVFQIAFDTNLSTEEQMELSERMAYEVSGYGFLNARVDAVSDFDEMYASLFLLGIFLSLAFMGACVLIMYFKQITEGYEDAGNYRIMRNVGMTRKEIKKSVNSQTLITFFSPLVAAGIHLAFSGPMVRTLLMYFGVGDITSFILTYLGCFVAFSLFYLLVYRKTVKAYVEIVSY